MKKTKTGGRQKGTPNKTTAFTKEVINNILEQYNNKGLLQSDLDALTPENRLSVIIKLIGYVIPKPQAVSIDFNNEQQKGIEDTLNALLKENP